MLYYPTASALPYESVFSIFLKLSHANFLELSALGCKLGNDRLSASSLQHWFKAGSVERLANYFPHIKDHLPWNYSPVEGLRNIMEGIAFCPDCIRFGYHSVFNLIEYHEVCVLHKCRLEIACGSCTESYLRGFKLSEIPPRVTRKCPDCGFEEIGLFRSTKMSHNVGLLQALNRCGEIQSSWYSQLKRGAEAGVSYSKQYYSWPVARENLTGPLEQALKISSPERLANFPADDQPVLWMYHPGFNERRESASPLEFRYGSAEEACLSIERTYLKGHIACLACANALTEYLDGNPKTAHFCSLALAYVLVRIKLAYHIWPNPSGVSALASGFKHQFNIISTMGVGTAYVEVRILFLSILGRLQFQISKGKDFLIVIRYSPEFRADYRWPIYIRRASYGFRTICQSQCGIELSRDEFGGPLRINFESDTPGAKDTMLIEQLVL